MTTLEPFELSELITDLALHLHVLDEVLKNQSASSIDPNLPLKLKALLAWTQLQLE